MSAYFLPTAPPPRARIILTDVCARRAITGGTTPWSMYVGWVGGWMDGWMDWLKGALQGPSWSVVTVMRAVGSTSSTITVIIIIIIIAITIAITITTTTVCCC